MIESVDGADVAAAIAAAPGATHRERVAAFFGPYLELMDPAVEADLTEVRIPGLTGSRHGREEIADFWSTWLEAWDEYRWQSSDWAEIGECVVVDVSITATSATVGAAVGGGSDSRYTHLYRFRDEAIVLFRLFHRRDDAIRAAEELH